MVVSMMIVMLLTAAAGSADNVAVPTAATTDASVGKVLVTQDGVPQRMNLQGYLTDLAGNPIPDTSLQMSFKMLRGGSVKWQETQACSVKQGLFSVSMGSVTSIPESVFSPGAAVKLGLAVGTDTFPWIDMTSVGFAYRSIKSDTAIYAQSSAGGPPSGPAGGDLDGTYPNPTVDGLQGRAVANTAPGANQVLTWDNSAWTPRDPTTGPHNHLGDTWTTSSITRGLTMKMSVSSANAAYGQYDSVHSSGTGAVWGGRFAVTQTGTGDVWSRGLSGIARAAVGSTPNSLTGVDGEAYTSGSVQAQGGYFRADDSAGAGGARAIRANAKVVQGTAEATGIFVQSRNYGDGLNRGAYFQASKSTGTTGRSKGAEIKASTATTNSSYAAIGVDVEARNSGNGPTYGGKFLAAGTGGTGPRYGVYSELGSGGSPRYAGYYVGDHVITGSKSAAVKLAEGDWRLVYCQESPEVWFEDFGESQLVDGIAHVELDETFLQTVTVSTAQPMKVFVELNDDCHGVFVQRGSTGFDVIEREGGTSSAHFTYRVVAKRRGYENLRLHRMESGTNPDELRSKNEAERAEDRRQAE